MNKQSNYRIDKELKERFDNYCKENDLITNKTLEKAIREFLEKKGVTENVE